MDLSSPNIWAALYGVAALGCLTSRLVCVYHARHALFRSMAASSYPAFFLAGSVCVLLVIAILWPLHALNLVVRHRTPPGR